MTKVLYYTYLGTNGTITSVVHLEDIHSVSRYQLTADEGKQLTKDGINFTPQVLVPVSEIEEWREVEK